MSHTDAWYAVVSTQATPWQLVVLVVALPLARAVGMWWREDPASALRQQ